jgi:hypothetical protein
MAACWVPVLRDLSGGASEESIDVGSTVSTAR